MKNNIVVNVADLVSGKQKVKEFYFEKEPFYNEDLSFNDTIDLKIKIFNTRRSLFVEGQGSFKIILQCSRCLEEYVENLNFSFKEDFVNFNSNMLNLNNVVREAMILAIPIKPLCSKDCKGICPKCGASLNKEACRCKVDSKEDIIDDRLYPLLKIKELYFK